MEIEGGDWRGGREGGKGTADLSGGNVRRLDGDSKGKGKGLSSKKALRGAATRPRNAGRN